MSISSVTTRGYGIAGGFTGSASLVVLLGYGSSDNPPPPAGNAQTGGLLLLGVGGVGVAGPALVPAPVPVDAFTNGVGTEFTVLFDREVQDFNAGNNGFSLVGDKTVHYTISYSTGEGTNTITFTVSLATIDKNQELELSYTPGDIAGLNGVLVDPITDYPVDNIVT